MPFKISYVFCTRNRLPYLKFTLGRLIGQLQADEEIIVVDGNSTDGTQAYLDQLFEAKKINQYVTEPDRNQAHGWNKALLMAKGTIVKKIIDDDVFDFRSIRKCADYMLAHPKVDVVISNDLSSRLDNPTEIVKNTRLSQYTNWATKQTSSFTFGDVHLLLRKSALALIGLYNTGYVMIDWEYSLRISYLQANIVYYTGYNALSVFQEQSVSGLKKNDEIAIQSKRAMFFYDYAGDDAEITLWSKIKIAIGKRIFSANAPSMDQKEIDNIKQIYERLYQAIEQINNAEEFDFITAAKINETKS
ncbi:glycosyltransferase [Pedobacter sp. KR3-3]|uniref:Glycosyltransferase n=1 Tax=Pedobacter albus TaxID=3113905 RepID=A0ABU7I6Y0_9SPHI|nr:glycosyltransferase [Pedobacter sp. KR3-3]MEE1945139.1 glycosyltransferase [Pedobacter sp. KR3-3]